MSDQPIRSYYSRSQMLWFGLLLNFGVAVWMLATNYARMGRPDLRSHALLIGALWTIAGTLLMATVWARTGDLQSAQSVWLLFNLVSVLTLLLVHEITQGAWVMAEREVGHTNISNWIGLVHAAVVCVATLFLISFTLVLAMSAGLKLPVELPPPPAQSQSGRDV